MTESMKSKQEKLGVTGPCLITLHSFLLKVRGGPESSRKLRFPDFMTTAQDGGKVASFTHRPPLLPGNVLSTHFF